MKFGRIFNNAKWIILCKLLQSVLQLIVGMLCARYLGPSNYGLINYAASVLAFFLPIMRLGLNETLVHELTEDPEQEGTVMGTALVMNLLSSLACMLLVYSFVSVANRGDTVAITVCVLYSISLLFGALEMIQYWFQYKLLAKYSSVVMLIAYVLVSGYKIALLIMEKSVYWFAVTHSVEYAIISVSLILIYLSGGRRLSFSLQKAKKMLQVSRSYIFASMMVVVFQSTDHIMLTAMIGTEANGIYSAAITCATITQFVYVAIVDSFRPVILAEKRDGTEDYERNVSRLYCVVVYLALAQSIAFTLLAKPMVWILYGEAYADTVPVLRILNWYFVFACMGLVRNVWILAEQKQKYLWRVNLSGALANILMNAVLIPLAGAAGAAFASMLTQFFANVVMGYLISPIRKNNTLMLRGLSPRFLKQEARQLIRRIR